MSKYEPLGKYLSESKEDNVALTFDEIEGILKSKLPSSACKSPGFWYGTLDGSPTHRHKGVWQKHGYQVKNVDLNSKVVVFELCNRGKVVVNVTQDLYSVILNRKDNLMKKSYTCYLFKEGVDKILKKCGEECSEMIIAAKNNDNYELKNEVADLLYHVLVLCAERGLEWDDVEEVLINRLEKIGNLKIFKSTDKNT